MKTCKKCGQEHPIDDHTVDARYKDGRYPWCSACRRAWRQARKGKQRELYSRWADENRDRVRELGRETYHRNKEAIAPKRREYDRKRWKEQPEVRARKNEQDRARLGADPAARARKNAASGRAYHRNYQSDPEYRQRRIDRNKTFVHLRRRRIKNTGSYSAADWRALCAKYNHRCLCCGEQKPLTPDHIVPLSRKGSNTIDNIQPLCLACNMRKATKTIDYRPDGGG